MYSFLSSRLRRQDIDKPVREVFVFRFVLFFLTALVRKIAYQANLAVQNWKIEQARGSAVNVIQV